MPTLITSDWHLNDLPHDEYRHAFVATLPALVQERGIDRILLLGDLTEAKDRHSARLVNRIADALRALSRLCAVVILRGNHDAATPDWPFFRFLRHVPNITWINKPKAIGYELFLPHTVNYKKDWAGFRLSEYKWIYAHNTFSSARSESGSTLDGIPTSMFPRGVQVIAGDVHVPQTLDCVTYVGAPYTINFGDTFDPRMLIIDAGKAYSVATTGPRKRLGEYRLGQPLDKALGFNKGDILKIRIHLEPEKAPHWFEIRQSIYTWGERHGFVIDSVEPIVNMRVERASGSRVGAARRVNDEELLRAYAQRQGLDKRLLKVGLQLMKERT